MGDDVRRFKVGDRVFGESKDTRAFGSFICVPEDECALMPNKYSFEEMACVPLAGLTAF